MFLVGSGFGLACGHCRGVIVLLRNVVVDVDVVDVASKDGLEPVACD